MIVDEPAPTEVTKPKEDIEATLVLLDVQGVEAFGEFTADN